MHSAMVIAVLLASLGSDNNRDGTPDLPPVYDAEAVLSTNSYPVYTEPASHSGYYTPPASFAPEPTSRWDMLRSTFCSFFLGRDADVATPSEIEASVYGYVPGR
jgi:hypothetical protein